MIIWAAQIIEVHQSVFSDHLKSGSFWLPWNFVTKSLMTFQFNLSISPFHFLVINILYNLYYFRTGCSIFFCFSAWINSKNCLSDTWKYSLRILHIESYFQVLCEVKEGIMFWNNYLRRIGEECKLLEKELKRKRN